ncbi:hypothetical protein [Paraflavitalea sp. CAU 1676]|uniref:hypothetical protein n=1 Tax=Paraflavitalea sp. CAU 1676 TaxID=3032598 RepID=UPI0023DA722A|nr:hypothetical protein [Paraflavitalea sp. CAU 1676]MDF2188648.1 hypothetical protein [Paraflavitalea sp. CAU 1676]
MNKLSLMTGNKQYREKVYTDKQPHEVSWTQDIPAASLDFIRGFNLPRNASIIDIGGGDSKLIDFLLMQGFQNITILDISEQGLESYQSGFPGYFCTAGWCCNKWRNKIETLNYGQ